MCKNCIEKDHELARLRRKLWVIQEISRIKKELSKLDAVSDFRRTVVNRRYNRELKEIFGVPFHCVKDRYINLLNERNHICHAYSSFKHDSVMPSYW